MSELNDFKPRTLADLEREHIVSTLRYYFWNKHRAAQALGITVKTLYNKLNSYGWDRWNGLNGEGVDPSGRGGPRGLYLNVDQNAGIHRVQGHSPTTCSGAGGGAGSAGAQPRFESLPRHSAGSEGGS